MLGASEAYRAITDPLPLYEEKVRPAEEIDEDKETEEITEAMRWGLILEEPIRAEVAKRLSCTVADPGPHTLQINQDRPWQSCTLDGLFFQPAAKIEGLFADLDCDEIAGPGVLQIKTAGPFVAKLWEEDSWPLPYQVQTQHELSVTGCSWGIVAVLLYGQKFELRPFVADAEFQEEMIHAENQFMANVQLRTPPDPTGSIESSRVLQRLHPDDNGQTVMLPTEAMVIDAELQAVTEGRKGLEKREKELKNKLCAMIGPHTFGALPNGDSYSWKTQEGGGYTVDRWKSRVLRRKKAKK